MTGVLKLQLVSERNCGAEVGCAGGRLVNYLMACDEDSGGESEMSDATQYQTTCEEESQLTSCWDASTMGIQGLKTISLH